MLTLSDKWILSVTELHKAYESTKQKPIVHTIPPSRRPSLARKEVKLASLARGHRESDSRENKQNETANSSALRTRKEKRHRQPLGVTEWTVRVGEAEAWTRIPRIQREIPWATTREQRTPEPSTYVTKQSYITETRRGSLLENIYEREHSETRHQKESGVTGRIMFPRRSNIQYNELRLQRTERIMKYIHTSV